MRLSLTHNPPDPTPSVQLNAKISDVPILNTRRRHSAASRSCSVCRTIQPESSSRHRGGPMSNRWCVNYTGCRFNAELTTRCLCWHTRLWTRLYRSTSANASTAASTHGHYARRLRHCSSNRSLVQTSRNVLFDAPRLEFTSHVCHRKRLIVCIQIWAKNILIS